MAKVVMNGQSRTRILFEGIKSEAEKFVSDHYPRHHVQEGTRDDGPTAADVSVIDDDNKETSLHDGEFVPSKDGLKSDTSVEIPVEDDTTKGVTP